MENRFPEEIFYEDEELNQHPMRTNNHHEGSGHHDEHTNEENININASSVQVVSFDPSIL